jgi:hypothetical protein
VGGWYANEAGGQRPADCLESVGRDADEGGGARQAGGVEPREGGVYVNEGGGSARGREERLCWSPPGTGRRLALSLTGADPRTQLPLQPGPPRAAARWTPGLRPTSRQLP